MVKEGVYLGFGGQHLSSRLNYTVVSVTVKRNVRRFLELCRKVNKDSHYITGIHLFFLHVCSIIWTCVFAKKLLFLLSRPPSANVAVTIEHVYKYRCADNYRFRTH